MSHHPQVTFQDALEAVEALPEDQQEDLIDILRRRQIERRRELLADRIGEARVEYAKGEVRRGSVEDLMRELEE
jgi:hypothetical protein